ncbi:MAG: hypothetical protein ABIC95_00135 [archaeon]
MAESILEKLMEVRTAPTLNVDTEPISGDDWFSFLFSKKFPLEYSIGHETQSEKFDPNLILMAFVISDHNIFADYRNNQDISREDIRMAIMREVTHTRTGEYAPKNATLGSLVVDYAHQVGMDTVKFKPLYLGDVTVEDVIDSFGPTPNQDQAKEFSYTFTPPAQIAASALLSAFPAFNVENPYVGNVDDLRDLIAGEIIYQHSKNPYTKRKMREVFMRHDVKPSEKLLYNALLFNTDYVKFIAKTISRS